MKLALLGGVVAAVTPLIRLHRAGFCFPEGRFLSDRERIRTAAEYVVRWGAGELWVHPRADGDGDQVRAKMVRHWTAPEFLGAYPDCCRIGGAGPPDILPIRAGQLRITTVVLDVPIRLGEQDATDPPSVAQTVVAVGACGEFRGGSNFRRIAHTLWRAPQA